ncbi:hypothetical protein Hdeb2414_s0008g00288121 [Helianthus debilis subsp. tardiflorus]
MDPLSLSVMYPDNKHRELKSQTMVHSQTPTPHSIYPSFSFFGGNQQRHRSHRPVAGDVSSKRFTETPPPSLVYEPVTSDHP